MQVNEFSWEAGEIYGEYFNSDIAEFKRTVSVVRVRQAACCESRVVARQGTLLAWFAPDGGSSIEQTHLSRYFEHSQLDCLALSGDGELLALGCGHQVQYVKFNDGRFLPTGKRAGIAGSSSAMQTLSFIDKERCLGISQRSLLLFELGVCLSQRELPGGPVCLQGERVLVAERGVIRLHNALDWEKLQEWSATSVRTVAMSGGGQVAWIDHEGLRLGQFCGRLEAGPNLPSWDQPRLGFAGERLFLSDGSGRVWNLRPQDTDWQLWPGPFLGISNPWWFDQTPDGFRSYRDVP